ncbi:MAG TPA: tetratricopeptide repeat protein, partial [Xanthobacteraceae bacterium]|nr:tetratricopeptide repeat protein [Xanthobacteraceae bacterium]
RGHAGFDRKRYDEALTAFDKAITLEPDLAEAWLGRGNVCFDLKRHDEALAAFAKALALKPDLAQAWLGRGNIFANLRRYDEAFAAFDKAIALEPDLAAAWFGRGTVCFDLKRHDDAFAAYDKALALKPDLGLAEALRLHAKMHLCDWSNFDTEADHLMNGKERGEPFALLSISNSPGLQLQCARFTSEKIPLPKMPLWHGEIYKHDKIRLGYLSPDFRHHPVAYLLAGVFENHDRRHFQTFAFSTGPGDNSEMRDRLTRAFDQFIDVNGKSDGDIAGQIRALDIDILIDLGGYTADSRVPILAQRAAPVQVNYLGYAGTMGANYVDYLIADRTLVPPSHQIYYTEKIVYLPHCFMPSDAKGRNISDKPLRRSDFGLPENGFVFCCFNNAYKFNPELFRSWMRIMKAIDDSVLWLSELSETARTNLKKHADAAGVDPERLVFAKRLASSSEHLARHKLADLFIDTLPYNAHTTASDALWTGLPVLTQIGETFAARVAASLLNAIGLPELITRSRQDYERLAIELANGPAKLAAIKEKLEANRSIAPLFDTQLFTRHLEAAYRQMSERYRAGLAPDHFAVSAGEIPGR